MDKIKINREHRTKETLQVQERKGIYYLTFPALSECGIVRHLFTTRLGGVSKGIYSSMNVSFTRGDDPNAVKENYSKIAAILDCRLEDIVCSDQTHTANIRIVTEADKGKGIVRQKDYHNVDGLVTDVPGIVLATFFADCVPVYFVDTVRHVAGLVHSGWRGTVQKIGAQMIHSMKEQYGSKPENIIAAIGPSICQSCYEVSADVADAFREAYKEALWEEIFVAGKEDGKYQLNLWAAIYHTLLEADLHPEQISVTDICTCCNPDVLFSHRASKGKRGNLGAFLMLSP